MMSLKRKIFSRLTNRQKHERRTWHAPHPAVRTRIIDDNFVREPSPSIEYSLISAAEDDGSNTEFDNSVKSDNSIYETDDNLADISTDSNSGESTDEPMNEESIACPKESFRSQLADCFLKNNINHVQGNSMLSVLRSHKCLFPLPEDTRTILQTCNRYVELVSAAPGEYWHVGLVVGILQELSNQDSLIPDFLELDLSTDGVAAEKNGPTQYWPIQHRIVNISKSSILIAGVYRGKGKPESAESFFRMLTDEVKEVFANGGIVFQGRLIAIKFRYFMADAPAKALILNHKSHMSSKPCSKCMVAGSRFENRTMIFRGTGHRLRTDLEYKQRVDDDHHEDKISSLTHLRISGVLGTLLDIMHLGYLGVMKEICEAEVNGKHSRRAK